MKLDEAIVHAREVAKRNREQWKNCPTDRRDIEHQTCEQCAEEYEQLATWLKNAYKSGYNKAINDFADELKHSLLNNYRHFLRMDSDGFEWLTTDAVETHIDETLKKCIVKGGE